MEKNLKENILKWKYNSTDQSIVYPYIKKYMTVPISTIFNYKISPNLITILGFLFTVTSVLICLTKESLTIYDRILISFLNFIAFVMDAVDGIQGRKWMEDKRDVYVLTQLYDHGFDSITTFLNNIILVRVFKFQDPFALIMLHITVNGTFLMSTFSYKVERCMNFKIHNNPTEAVVLNCLLIIFSGYLKEFPDMVYVILMIVAIQGLVFNVYYILSIALTSNSPKLEKGEALINMAFYLSVYSVFNHLDTDCQGLFLVLSFLICHLMTINYIVYEIYKQHCFWENFIICIPIVILEVLIVFFQYDFSILIVLKILCLVYTIAILLKWKTHSSIICDALKLNYFWSIPEVNNNPYVSSVNSEYKSEDKDSPSSSKIKNE